MVRLKFDSQKVLEFLLEELGYPNVEEIIELAENPKFEETSRVHDWRNYVSPVHWFKKSLEARMAEVICGKYRAGEEEWE